MFLKELSKVPLLIEHFSTHKKENAKLTFIGFLKLHYQDKNHQSSDEQNHQSLPLHSTSISMTIAHLMPIGNLVDFEVKSAFPSFIKQKVNFNYIFSIPQSFLSLIFQPPQAA